MQPFALAIQYLPSCIKRPLYRWEVKTDETEGVRWITRQQALAYALGLSDGGTDCSVIGSRGRCHFVRAWSFHVVPSDAQWIERMVGKLELAPAAHRAVVRHLVRYVESNGSPDGGP